MVLKKERENKTPSKTISSLCEDTEDRGSFSIGGKECYTQKALDLLGHLTPGMYPR